MGNAHAQEVCIADVKWVFILPKVNKADTLLSISS